MQEFTIQKLPKGVTATRIRQHEMEPARLRNIEMVPVEPSKEKLLRTNLRVKTFKANAKPKLDLGAFCDGFHAIMKSQVTGYELMICRNGTKAAGLRWNWGQTPADANKGWNDDTQMHIASVSKLLTAIGMMKALDSKGISYGTSIINYLPSYWSKGSNISGVTFRDLLTHKSGFPKGDSQSSFPFMKGRVAAGVASNPGGEYANMNFGLCRILIPIVMGDISKSANPMPSNTGLNDLAWDALTLYHYKDYMQDNVFTPAGVSNAGFAPTGSNRALAYKFPHNGQKGWDSGDLASMAGGAAWRLSAEQVLKVLHHARRRNTILPADKFQYLLDNYFGIDQIIDSPAGKLYNKNGGWSSNSSQEQCVAYVLPDGLEAMVMVNSPIGTEKYSLRGIFKDVYLSCLSD